MKLKSSGGKVFGAHQTNLEVFSDAFPMAGSTTAEEVVTLEENSGVLRLMLQFMHNTRQPNLSKVPFSTLAPLAEAVEKYMIYSAMQICHTYMGFVYSASDSLAFRIMIIKPVFADKQLKITRSRSLCTL